LHLGQDKQVGIGCHRFSLHSFTVNSLIATQALWEVVQYLDSQNKILRIKNKIKVSAFFFYWRFA
jgi:hypothetical protein